MLVYGDRERTVDPREVLSDIAALLPSPSYDKHTSALILAGELAQGIADAEFEACGCDDVSPAQTAALALATSIARRLRTDSPAAAAGALQALQALRALSLPPTISCRTPEGFAFYAVYPEAYAAAAAAHAWTARPLIIGVRSIGTSLAAIVAATTDGQAITLRPKGHPFRRTVAVSDRLRGLIRIHEGPFAIVDEGPGLSGSSFGCVADLLEDLGVGPERIVFMPSHAGDVGPDASPRHRMRWSRAIRLVRTLDDLSATRPLSCWFEHDVGAAEAVEDLSAGAWRQDWPKAARPPVTPALERRKVRFRTETGAFVARFAGLGRVGEAKFERALALHGAGFGPEPIALRRGFLLERWIAGRPLDPFRDRTHLLRTLGDYLAFRAEWFVARSEDGADAATLCDMACENTAALCGSGVAARVEELVRRLERPPRDPRPVHVDGRLHPWEWRCGPGGLCKLDGLDHSCGHDLVGTQDITWDLAGATVEFGLTAGESEDLARRLGVQDALVRPMTACYAAFQAGLWSMAGQADDADDGGPLERRLELYRHQLQRLATDAH
jgi:hypothetical protein